jgi:hypothetical protein
VSLGDVLFKRPAIRFQKVVSEQIFPNGIMAVVKVNDASNILPSAFVMIL